MAKINESSEPEVPVSKKGGWPLLIGVWALVEAVASGWGVGAAFLAHYWQVSSKKKDKLTLLRNPETAKKLSAYQAHQLLFSFSMIYFIPLILFIISVIMIKVYMPNNLTNISSVPFLNNSFQKLCIYSDYAPCPTSISLLYIGITALFSIILILMVTLSVKNILLIHVKSYLFRFAYDKWMFDFVIIPTFVLILFIFSFVVKNFAGLFIKLLTPGEIDFNAYIQGSIILIFVPLFFYTAVLYFIAAILFVNIRISIEKKNNIKSPSERVEFFSLILDAENLNEIKNTCREFNVKTSKGGVV